MLYPRSIHVAASSSKLNDFWIIVTLARFVSLHFYSYHEDLDQPVKRYDRFGPFFRSLSIYEGIFFQFLRNHRIKRNTVQDDVVRRRRTDSNCIRTK